MQIASIFNDHGYKRVIKSPKLYFTDTGLAAYLLGIRTEVQMARDPLRGNLFENLVVMECYKTMFNACIKDPLYFYRDSNQNEIDLLFKRGSNFIPIEIKSSETFHSNFAKEIKKFNSISDNTNQGFVIYAGNNEFNTKSIDILNYHNTYKIWHRQLNAKMLE